MEKTYYAGLDLHSNNVMIAIMDGDGKRIIDQKLACQLAVILKFLEPYRKQLKALAVESTYNWYWLVDGLRAHHYPVVLANPSKMSPYRGLKHSDDRSDAFFLAELLRLKILPEGYIYDPQWRSVRDLLRRRSTLVQQRTALLVSFKSQHTRMTGSTLTQSRVKTMSLAEAEGLYEHAADQLIARVHKTHINQLNESIQEIERLVEAQAKTLAGYERLLTVPGIGRILAMTIRLELGDISRFPEAGNFASYCRTVAAKRTSNDKKKGDNNRKCGNRYLGWALIETANFACRYDEQCRRWYDRKALRRGKIIARKALACKLAKACWHVLDQDVDYDAERVFGKAVESPVRGLEKANAP